MNMRFFSKSPHINVMVKAAQKAARILAHDFGEVEQLQVTRKSLGDFVSRADRNSERAIVEELSKARPDYSFLLEEGGEKQGTNEHFRWIVDPLDGTTNFLHGIPHFAISIGLEQDGHIIAGVIYDPIKDELFWAEKGAGAFLNQKRLRVSGRKHMDEAIIGTGIPSASHGHKDLFLKNMKSIMPHVAGVRRMGAASLDLAYVAAGRYDIYFENDCAPWDYAAGIIIVKEAGGFISDFSGKQNMLKNGEMIATNAYLNKSFQEMVK